MSTSTLVTLLELKWIDMENQEIKILMVKGTTSNVRGPSQVKTYFQRWI